MDESNDPALRHPPASRPPLYPIGTVVRLKKTGEFALIVEHSYQKDGQGFLNYVAQIEGRRNVEIGKGGWSLYHDEIELEQLP